MNKIVDVRNLNVSFPGTAPVVHNLSFNIQKGEVFGIVGESGSGKSITALSLFRLLPDNAIISDKSEIIFDGKNILAMSETELCKIRGLRAGFVFQEPSVSMNPIKTIRKQISAPIILHNFDNLRGKKKEIDNYIEHLLRLVGFPEGRDRLDAYPHQLSGGQKQRITIAMALACRPDIIIADEPTTALDVTVQEEILHNLKELQERMKMTLLLISHNLEVISKMANRIAVMRDGTIIESGVTESIVSAPQHPYTKHLWAARDFHMQKKNATRNPLLLEVKDLCVDIKSYHGFFPNVKNIVSDISFDVKKTQTVGIVGESGSGKTTIALAILRMIKSQGQIIFEKQDLNKMSMAKIRPLRSNIQMVFQDPYSSLNPRMSVSEILREGLMAHKLVSTKAEAEEAAKMALCDVGLSADSINRYPHEFSGGQRQRIAIARAIALNPRLILLDEPTSSLDLTVQEEIVELLISLQNRLDISYIFITHDLRLIQKISHSVIVMSHGKIIEAGSTSNIFTHPQQEYTKCLINAAYLRNV